MIVKYVVHKRAMFAIGGNVAVPKYRKAKYEPLEAVYETQKEVGHTTLFHCFRWMWTFV